MSLDKSLKTAANLSRHRNVLRRHERIDVLREEERWREGQAPVGLPKVAHRKANIGGKDKKAKGPEKEEGKK
ncbi:MAG: small basic protein [Phycisphaerales bacterium]|nr:small basic protein [Phycisphaerales bacterium]